MKAGALTCRALVEPYLRRIEAYDKNGPAINAIVVVNPDALKQADELDRRFAQADSPVRCTASRRSSRTTSRRSACRAPTGRCRCKGFVSNKDAFQVKRIKEAGAIVLAKSNMAEFAFSPYETVNSILPGYTQNPYALDRVTAGSSGGTAAAVAANFGADRPRQRHRQLDPRPVVAPGAGRHPLDDGADEPRRRRAAQPARRHRRADGAHASRTPSPCSRSIAGEDPDDPGDAPAAPAAGTDRRRTTRRRSQRDGLKGARIGVLRQAYERDTTDPEIVKVFMARGRGSEARRRDDRRSRRASSSTTIRRPQGAGRAAGSSTTSTATWPRRATACRCTASRRSSGRGASIRRSQPRLEQAQEGTENGPGHAGVQGRGGRIASRSAPPCRRRWTRSKLDAFVYPTWSNPPRLIGDLNTPHGDNSQVFSPTTGFPAINVPMGYTRGTLPAGMTFFGRAWSEAALIKLAYAYEQATHHRRPPAAAPPLR